MTCVAWDGTTLAADKQSTNGAGGMQRVTKIQRTESGALLAITGCPYVAAEMVAWFKAGREPKDFPESARGDKSTLIAIVRNEVWQYTVAPYPMFIEGEHLAWGSGQDYAKAAMYLGKSAAEGVEIACHFQSDCGMGIDTLRLE